MILNGTSQPPTISLQSKRRIATALTAVRTSTAWGRTLYFVLPGHAPFPEGSGSVERLMHQTKEPRSIFEDRPDAPNESVAICERMLAKSRDARQQTAAEVARELYFWLGGRGPGISPYGS